MTTQAELAQLLRELRTQAEKVHEEVSRLTRVIRDVDVTRPTTPSGFGVNPLSATTINILWTASTDPQGATNEANTGVAGYRVYRDGVVRTTTTSLSFLDTGLTEYTLYSYYVTAIDGATPANESVATATLSPRTFDVTAPTAPVITATATGQTTLSVALTTASTDAGSGVSTYRLEYKRSVDSTWTLDSASLTSASFPRTISGLTAVTGYDTRCRATDVSGNVGNFSATSSATTQSTAVLPLGDLTLDGVATPEQLSLYIPVTGSLTTAATATCRYKLTADSVYTTGHPFYRVRPSLNPVPDFGGSIADVFAWTIIGLAPGASYDVEVTCSDGSATNVKTLTVSTRSLPSVSGATTVSVAAGSTAAQIASAINGAAAGAVIQIQGNCNVTGTISITSGGTLASPKYVRGASRSTTIARTNAAGDIISLTGAIGHIVFEDLTITGDGTDAVPPTINALVSSDTALKTNITFRRITSTGINRGFHITNGSGCLYYDCTLTGNNLWTTTPVDFLTGNRSWNDDGVMLAGRGNCAFNNTLKGFGDTIAYTSHAEADVDAIACHAWENDIRNSCDDSNEMDHARRNCTFYDNRIHNCMSSSSFDPSGGGPFLIARNIFVNQAAYTMFKWNEGGAGWFVYNNVIAATVYNLRSPSFTQAMWVKFNDGPNTSYGVRNNVFIAPTGLNDNIIVESTGHDPLDWTHNTYNRDFGIQFNGSSFATLAAAQSGISNRTAVFGSLYSPNNRPFAQDNVSAANPFTTAITLGATSSVEVTSTFTPAAAVGNAHVKNTGVVIPNITDGYTGAAPDRGAIIAGRSIPLYGDQSGTPAYISALAPYQVLELTSTTSGNGTMQSVTPAEWQGSTAPNNLNSVLIAWSGGGKSLSGRKLIVHGGGHNDSANNGVYVYDFDGSATPAGYESPLKISALSAIRDQNTYTDGAASSVHGYDGTAYMGGVLYRFLGSRWQSGGTAGYYKFNTATGLWSSFTTNPGISLGFTNRCICIPDESTGKIFVMYQGFNQGFFYRVAADTWSSGFDMGFTVGDYPTGVRGPGTESIIIGSGGARRLCAINFSSESASSASFSSSGSDSLLGGAGVSAAYDSVRDSYWIWGGDAGSLGWSNIYEMARGTWVVTAHALSSTIPQIAGMIFSTGRFVFMTSERAIGVVTRTTGASHVIRLPS